MKEKDYSIDEVFDTGRRENVKKRNKGIYKFNKICKKKILIIIGIFLIFALLVLFVYLITNRKPIIKENLVYGEFEPLVSKLNNNEYYIFGAKRDISFEVEKQDNFNYKVLDEDNNEITVNLVNNNNKVTIKAPNDLYLEGKTYKIEINNGKFTNDNYKDGKIIIFNIARPSSNTYELNKNVIVVDNNKASIKDNNLVIDGNYKENDVIVVMEDNKLKSSYKIVNDNGNGRYQVSVPKTNEIFNKIDYYGMEKVNLASFSTNEELKTYIIGMIRKSILNSLVDTVYAKSNVQIKEPTWNNKEQTLEFIVEIDTGENTKVFDKDFLKGHKTIIEYDMKVSANLYKNVTLDKFDYALEFEYSYQNKVNLSSINENINNLNKSINNNIKEYDANWLIDDYKKMNNDKAEFNKSLGNIMISTEVPGLFILFDEGIIFNSDIKAFLNTNISGNIRANVGMNSNKKIYSNIIYTCDGDLGIVGDGKVQSGFLSKSSLVFLNNIIMNSDINYGLYVESISNSKLNDDNKDKKIITYELKANNNVYLSYKIKGIINGEEINKTILDEKREIKKYEKKMEFSIKEEDKEKDKDNEKDKIINNVSNRSDEIRRKLQKGYDEIKANDEWNLEGGTFVVSFNYKKEIDVNKNTFTTIWTYDDSISYTCNYDYVNKTMSCSDYDKAVSYVKNACDSLYNEYLEYIESGDTDNDDAPEWENIYDSVDTCYYEAIDKNEPKDFNEDIDKILKQVGLSQKDLLLLK